MSKQNCIFYVILSYFWKLSVHASRNCISRTVNLNWMKEDDYFFPYMLTQQSAQ